MHSWRLLCIGEVDISDFTIMSQCRQLTTCSLVKSAVLKSMYVTFCMQSKRRPYMYPLALTRG